MSQAFRSVVSAHPENERAEPSNTNPRCKSPSPPDYRKGISGRFLRRPRQHNAAATVAEYCSAVYRHPHQGSHGPLRPLKGHHLSISRNERHLKATSDHKFRLAPYFALSPTRPQSHPTFSDHTVLPENSDFQFSEFFNRIGGKRKFAAVANRSGTNCKS